MTSIWRTRGDAEAHLSFLQPSNVSASRSEEMMLAVGLQHTVVETKIRVADRRLNAAMG